MSRVVKDFLLSGDHFRCCAERLVGAQIARIARMRAGRYLQAQPVAFAELMGTGVQYEVNLPTSIRLFVDLVGFDADQLVTDIA